MKDVRSVVYCWGSKHIHDVRDNIAIIMPVEELNIMVDELIEYETRDIVDDAVFGLMG
jgi:hypothetical protein